MSNPPSIMHVLTRLGGGGPPLFVVRLSQELGRRGYPTVLATGSCGEGDMDMSYLLRDSDRVIWVPEMSRSLSPLRDIQATWKLFRIMLKMRPDIVHTHTAKAGTLGRVAAILAGVPIIVHTYHGNVMSRYFSEPVSVLIRLWERFLARFTNVLCTLSPQQRWEIADRFRVAPAGRVRVIPIGVDLAPCFAVKRSHAQGGTVTVCWLGRFAEIKDVPLLLEVISEVLRRADNIRFIIAGDGPLRSLVDGVARRHGASRVQWLGWVQDVTSVLQQSDVILQTSRNEGTPIALIQAMAAGLPFVSTRAGGVVDMVSGDLTRHDKGAEWYPNAVLCKASPAMLARVIQELADDAPTRSRMGEQGRLFAARNYQLQHSVEASIAMYSELYGVRHDTGTPRAARYSAAANVLEK